MQVNAETERNSLNTKKLPIGFQSKMVRHENTHTNDIIQNEQDMFRSMYVCAKNVILGGG